MADNGLALGSFDLTSEPWIPVWSNSQIRYCSLRSVFLEADKIDWLACENVLQMGGVLRLLEALTYRIANLDAERVAVRWVDKRNIVLDAGAFEAQAVNAYFDQWQHRFGLFDAHRPFGQDPRLIEEGIDARQIGKLVFGVPAGNTPAWFERADVTFVASDAAQWLLASLCFATGGRTSARQGDADSVAATSRNRVSIHLRGDSLFTSLLANLRCPATGIEPLPWECELPAVNKAATLTSMVDVANTALGRWRHAFLLERAASGAVSKVRATWLHRKVEEVDDPHLVYYFRRGTKGAFDRLTKSADRSSHLWRDVLALREDPLLKEHGKESGVAVLSSTADLDESLLDTLSVIAIVHQADKSNDLLSWDATMPRGVVKWLLEDDEARQRAERLLALVQDLHRSLRAAFNHLRKEVGKPVARDFDGLRDGALARFFAEAERRFWAAMDESTVSPRLALLALATFDEAVTKLADIPQYSYHIVAARKKIVAAGWPAQIDTAATNPSAQKGNA